MPRLTLAALSIFALAGGATSAQAQTTPGWFFGGEVYYSHYRETVDDDYFVRDYGIAAGIDLSYTRKFNGRYFVTGRGRLAYGVVATNPITPPRKRA
ncbi:MAG: hypothetical protein ACM33T_09240 [Solirubrobacterales bacterium]